MASVPSGGSGGGAPAAGGAAAGGAAAEEKVEEKEEGMFYIQFNATNASDNLLQRRKSPTRIWDSVSSIKQSIHDATNTIRVPTITCGQGFAGVRRFCLRFACLGGLGTDVTNLLNLLMKE